MPRQIDSVYTKVTHHPTQRIDPTAGRLPPFKLTDLIGNFARAMNVLFGIDISKPAGDDLFDQIVATIIEWLKEWSELAPDDWDQANTDVHLIAYPFLNLSEATAEDWLAAWRAWEDLQNQFAAQWDALWESLFYALFDLFGLPRPNFALVRRDLRLMRYPWLHLIADGERPAATWTDWKRSFHAWLDMSMQLDMVWDAFGQGLWNQLFAFLHIEPPDWAPINVDLKAMRYPFLHLFGDTLEPIEEGGPDDPDNPDATLDNWPFATLTDWAKAWAAWLDFNERMAAVWDKFGEGLWNLIFLTFGIEPPDWTRVSADLRLIRYPFMHMIGNDDILGTGVSWPQATWHDWVAAWNAAVDLWEALQIVSDEFWHGLIDRIFDMFNLEVPDWTQVNADLHAIRFPFMHLAPVGSPGDPDYQPAATWQDWVDAWDALRDLQTQFGIIGDAFWEGLYNLLFDAWNLPRPDWTVINGLLHTIRWPFIHLTEATPADWTAAWGASVELFNQLNLVNTGFWQGVTDTIYGWLHLPAPNWEQLKADSATLWYPFWHLDTATAADWQAAWDAGIRLLGGTTNPNAAGWVADLLGLGDGFDLTKIFNDLFGWLFPWLTAPTPISSLRASNPELLVNPDFTGAVSVAGGSGWSWDGAVYRTSSGSVRVDADGSKKGLVSNGIQVTAGESLTCSVYAKASGLAGGGNPVTMGVRTSAGDINVLVSTRPGGAWEEMTGVFEVPEGITEIAMRLGLTADATAGSVWFDDASVKRDGGDRFMNDVNTIFALFGDLLNPQAWTDAWEALLDIFAMFTMDTDGWATPNPGTLFAAWQEVGDAFWYLLLHLFDMDAWKRMGDAITNLFNAFFGLNKNTPSMAAYVDPWRELGDATWYFVTHFWEAAAWDRLSKAINAVIRQFLPDTSSTLPTTSQFFTDLNTLGAKFNALLMNLGSATAWNEAWAALQKVVGYIIPTTGWTAPNPGKWTGLLNEFINALIDLFNDLLNPAKWETAWNKGLALLGIVGVSGKTAPTAAFSDVFDDTRRNINAVLQSIGFGYLDSNWTWKAGTAPTADMPGGNRTGTFSPTTDTATAITQRPPAPWFLSALALPRTGTSVPTGSLYYVVTAVKGGVESLVSNEAFGYILLTPAQVNLSWWPVTGASSYRIYRGSSSGTYDRLVGTTSSTSFIDTGAATSAGSPPKISDAVGVVADRILDTANRAINLSPVNGSLPAASVSDVILPGGGSGPLSSFASNTNSRTQGLDSSGQLPTTKLTGNLSGNRVTVNSGALLNNWSSSVDSFMSAVFGKASASGGKSDYQLSTTAGTFFIPGGLFANVPFVGNKVSHNGAGALTFEEAGWYHFVVSFKIKWSTTAYVASCCLLDAGKGIFLEGHAYSNPSGAILFDPVLQCNGLVNVPVAGTYYAGYSISATGFGTSIFFDGSAGPGQLYISATKLK